MKQVLNVKFHGLESGKPLVKVEFPSCPFQYIPKDMAENLYDSLCNDKEYAKKIDEVIDMSLKEAKLKLEEIHLLNKKKFSKFREVVYKNFEVLNQMKPSGQNALLIITQKYGLKVQIGKKNNPDNYIKELCENAWKEVSLSYDEVIGHLKSNRRVDIYKLDFGCSVKKISINDIKDVRFGKVSERIDRFEDGDGCCEIIPILKIDNKGNLLSSFKHNFKE